MAERGVDLDHATLNRWVSRYAGLIAEAARNRKHPADRSWRMDETYVWVKGKWVYLYRAIDKHGKTLDFMLNKRRDKAAATKLFARALEVNGLPRKIVIDKSGANAAGIREVNKILNRFGCLTKIETVRSKYLNNLIEQDHRFIKRRVRHMCRFKSFRSASATLDGIEVANMIRKQQFSSTATSGFRLFAEIAG